MADFSGSDLDFSQDLFPSQESELRNTPQDPSSNTYTLPQSEIFANAESENESNDGNDEEILSSDDEDELPVPVNNTIQIVDRATDTTQADLPLLSTSGQSTRPAWDWTEVQDHIPHVEEFDSSNVRWNHNLTCNSTILETFQVVFPPEAKEIIIQETNRYADSTANCLRVRWERWTSVTEDEIMRYLGVLLFMGINKKPEIRQHWSRDPLFQQNIVPKMMTQDRFMEISKYLHFCNNEEQQPLDRTFKIRRLWETCNSNFQQLLVPGKNLAVDESLILYKGHLYFKQYIPTKRSRFGIKTFSVVDDATNFVLNSIIYAGKNHEMRYCIKEFGYGGAMVLELMEPYFNKYHHVFCENFFTGPDLARNLLERGTYLCGTLRSSRKNTPKTAKMKKGDLKVFSSESIMIEHWRDKKVVRMISTCHEHNLVPSKRRHSGEVIMKPKTVMEYNKHARGIDKGDMMMHLYSVKRKARKWYKKIFHHIIDLCAYNSYVIFRLTHPDISFLDFRIGLIRQIIETYPKLKPVERTASENPLRLNGKHFLEYNPATPKRIHGQRKCVVCAKTIILQRRKTSMTTFRCSSSKVALCPVYCHERYHTVNHY